MTSAVDESGTSRPEQVDLNNAILTLCPHEFWGHAL